MPFPHPFFLGQITATRSDDLTKSTGEDILGVKPCRKIYIRVGLPYYLHAIVTVASSVLSPTSILHVIVNPAGNRGIFAAT